jgi:hypothetical protein
MDAYLVFFTGIGWSLADGYGPVLDLNEPGNVLGFLGVFWVRIFSVLPTVEVNLSFTGVSP